MGQTPGIYVSMRCTTHYFDFTGNNDIAGGATAIDVVEVRVPRMLKKARRANIKGTLNVQGLGRNGTSDGGRTYAGLTYAGDSYRDHGRADYQNRGLARLATQGDIDLLLPLPGLRSQYDMYKWRTDEVTENLVGKDENGFILHPDPDGHEVIGADLFWGLT